MDLNNLALITGSSSAGLFILAGILKLIKKSKGMRAQAPQEETNEESSELTG